MYCYRPPMGGVMPPVGGAAGPEMMFKDYNKFIADVQIAINNEITAVEFYTKLMDMAPCADAKNQIEHPRDDEMKHYRMLCQLYMALTGYQPAVQKSITNVTDFCSGIEEALNDELSAAESYRDMYLNTSNMSIRDILFEIMTDEMEHATRFSFVYSLADCEKDECETEK